MWNSETTQKFSIYLYNYQTESATKHEKAIMICSYFFLIPLFWTFGHQYYENESIHLNSWHHSHKKQRDGLGTHIVLVDIFTWTWNIWDSHTENTAIQTAKNGGFCEELLSEDDFEAVLVNLRHHDYDANASEAVQKISTRTLELCQLTKTANIIATSMKKHVYYLLIGDTSQVFVFFQDINKN